MGSNMQRQAVPLLKTESPIVGTGMEYKAGVDSGVCVLARKAGVVRSVSADEVTVTNDDGSVESYHITINLCVPTKVHVSIRCLLLTVGNAFRQVR